MIVFGVGAPPSAEAAVRPAGGGVERRRLVARQGGDDLGRDRRAAQHHRGRVARDDVNDVRTPRSPPGTSPPARPALAGGSTDWR